MYYEAANDLKLAVGDMDESLASSTSTIPEQLSKRKKNYKCLRWSVFIFLVACTAAIMITMCVTSD